MMDSKSASKISYKITQDLKARRQRFVDKDFPHDNRSLFSDASKHTKDADGKWESEYEWARLSDVNKDAKVFIDGVDSGDVVQGLNLFFEFS